MRRWRWHRAGARSAFARLRATSARASKPRPPGNRAWRRSPRAPAGCARWNRPAAVGHACSNTRVISVVDREGDIWGLYARQAEDPAAAGLLVRACRSKQRKVLVDGKKLDLGKHMDTLPPCASRSIEIPARGGRAARKKRKAVLALRIARVELVAPEGKSPRTLPMTAVLVAERNPPSGARQPLRWLLLCSEGEATPEWADRIRQWYETRWSVETVLTYCLLKLNSLLSGLVALLREASAFRLCAGVSQSVRRLRILSSSTSFAWISQRRGPLKGCASDRRADRMPFWIQL